MSPATDPNIHTLPSEVVRSIAIHIPPFPLLKLRKAFGDAWLPQDFSFALLNLRTIHKLWTDHQRIPKGGNFTSGLQAPLWHQLGSNYLAAFLVLAPAFKIPSLAECYCTKNSFGNRHIELYIVEERNRDLLRSAFMVAESHPRLRPMLLQTQFTNAKKPVLNEILTCLRILCCINMPDVVQKLIEEHFKTVFKSPNPVFGSAEDAVLEEGLLNSVSNGNVETIKVLHGLRQRIRGANEILHRHLLKMALRSKSFENVRLVIELFPIDLDFTIADDAFESMVPWDLVKSAIISYEVSGYELLKAGIKHRREEIFDDAQLQQFLASLPFSDIVASLVVNICVEADNVQRAKSKVEGDHLEQTYGGRLYRRLKPSEQSYEAMLDQYRVVFKLIWHWQDSIVQPKVRPAVAVFLTKNLCPLERFAFAHACFENPSGRYSTINDERSIISPEVIVPDREAIRETADMLLDTHLQHSYFEELPAIFHCNPVFLANGRLERYEFVAAVRKWDYEKMVSILSSTPKTRIIRGSTDNALLALKLALQQNDFVEAWVHISDPGYDRRQLLLFLLQDLERLGSFGRECILLGFAVFHASIKEKLQTGGRNEVAEIFEEHWDQLWARFKDGIRPYRLRLPPPLSNLTWNPIDYINLAGITSSPNRPEFESIVASPTIDPSVMGMHFVKNLVKQTLKSPTGRTVWPEMEPNRIAMNCLPILLRDPRVDLARILEFCRDVGSDSPHVFVELKELISKAMTDRFSGSEAGVRAFQLFGGFSDEVFGIDVSDEELAEAERILFAKERSDEADTVLRVVLASRGIIRSTALVGFLTACKDGDIDQVRSATLANPVSIQDGLLLACYCGHASVVDILLQHIDTASQSDRICFYLALRIACRRGHVDVVRSLLSSQNYCPREDPDLLIRNACAVQEEDKALDIVKLVLGRVERTGCLSFWDLKWIESAEVRGHSRLVAYFRRELSWS
ncbi:hypothetical protein HDU97_009794 [Phlyctochytrium planicorne]|nr:hypothetical protein HDU97_009794 [Phlyctochytrium planicorne]